MREARNSRLRWRNVRKEIRGSGDGDSDVDEGMATMKPHIIGDTFSGFVIIHIFSTHVYFYPGTCPMCRLRSHI
ncbi:hypothetical protein DPEC_G00105660 [Dallia pectoralis]|uniref:Uncharacterized protein n=1 Tax=Dallia pectoralis TaxID=75939 RepID=A0ACC2GYX3_DALPE|nr:hypothetical protein DPEC_G00105660 [Dallia pectoralis]